MRKENSRAQFFEKLREKAKSLMDNKGEFDPEASGQMMDLIDELRVRDVELEIQNEELQRAQEEFKELHEEYVQLYYEFAPCGYLTLSPEGKISRINLTGASMLNCERNRIYEKPFWNYVDTKSEYDYFETLKKLWEEKTSQRLEIKLIPKKGPSFWVQADVRPDLDETGRLIQIRMTLVDISHRVKAEKRLAKLNAELEERVRARTRQLERHSEKLRRLAFALSEAEDRERERIALFLHDDLQQHLAAVRFHLQILMRGEISDDNTKPKVSYIENLIDESIQKTRILSHELNPPVLVQSGLVGALEWLCQNLLEKHGFEATVESEGGIGTISRLTSSILFHSAKELLFNSIKHSGADKAEVTVKREDGFLTVKVNDRGKGFDKPKLKEKQEGGVAFGLFKIEERIRLMGGRLEVDSAPGGGCRITMSIPLQNK